jgi:hypothetical protein
MFQPGEHYGGAKKLTKSKVLEIRTLYAAGSITMAALGRRFGVTRQAISLLIKGRIWKYTDPQPAWPSPHQDTWNKRYGQLAAFFERFGHCNVPGTWPENPTLARWCTSQRKAQKLGCLRAERMAKLDALGFIWGQRVPNWSWEKKFRALEQFKLDHGHCNVPERQPSLALAHWISGLRKSRMEGRLTLSTEQIRRLDALGFRWEPLRAKWKTRMQELERFKLTHGHCNVPTGTLLGYWIHNQRQSFRKDQLSPEKIQRLDAVGFVWNRRLPVSKVPNRVKNPPNAAKTHCKRGHPLDGGGKHRDDGQVQPRYCKTCKRETDSKRPDRKRNRQREIQRRRLALTHCPNGHAYAETAQLDRMGRRRCTACPRGTKVAGEVVKGH